MCIKETMLTKVVNFIKRLFKKEKKQENINAKSSQEIKEEIPKEIKNEPKTKEELMEIYKKAKKGQYDLEQLQLEEINILNRLIEAEIEIKTRKLQELTN